MTKRKMISFLVAFAGIILLISLVPILGQRVVARAIAPDGTEMCIVQKFTWSPDIFNTKFACRKPGKAWQAYYYECEDYELWRRARVVLDSTNHIAIFYRNNTPVITYDWVSEAYARHGFVYPQMSMAADWAP